MLSLLSRTSFLDHLLWSLFKFILHMTDHTSLLDLWGQLPCSASTPIILKICIYQAYTIFVELGWCVGDGDESYHDNLRSPREYIKKYANSLTNKMRIINMYRSFKPVGLTARNKFLQQLKILRHAFTKNSKILRDFSLDYAKKFYQDYVHRVFLKISKNICWIEIWFSWLVFLLGVVLLV